jgi:hypothetical protein
MRKLLLTTALLGAVGVSPAFAANTALTLWNDANPGGAVTAIGTDTAILSGSSLGGITISTSGVARETVPNNGMTESNLFITNTTGTVQTLDILAGTNGFLGPNNAFNASATILIGTGQAELTGMFYVDPANTLNGVNTGPVVGTQIGGTFDSGLLTGPFSFSSNSADVLFSVIGPYGMAESLQLVMQPGAFIGVQSISMDATNAVPEPSTWVMMGGGFALLALLGLRKRNRTPRFAV